MRRQNIIQVGRCHRFRELRRVKWQMDQHAGIKGSD